MRRRRRDEQDQREPELPPDEPIDGQAPDPERHGNRRDAQDQELTCELEHPRR